ncbi:Putative flippase GtrA (transmembrane translocase of bactoprenol-linked glucose) [Propionibacterium cyclohexanicum]|uniref:Putative flippase GtrA (Transmembrane translocase of bactoprenol-linked glucose) n=1 Tax=Propionibacterium cyclohexanicum TaxID=64702 RepID=A0A1H9PQ39_9ACTN|nr:GtrA family protein [Propionibacterium cyclohexanicum]SER50342.1 Putative flippase GtrA (transmembrane translocase of bactoprenol-linked glucose) [Propionibacterium cyclohexanicum]
MSSEPVHSAPQRWRRLLVQFIRFGLVGGSGVVVNMAVAVVMNKLNGGSAHAVEVLFPIPGTSFNFRFSSLVWIVSFLIANTYNYQLNRTWTFRGTTRGWWLGFLQFMLIGAVAAFVGLILKAMMMSPASGLALRGPWFDGWQFRPGGALVDQIEDAFHSREYVSQAVAIVVTMPINFIVNKLITFRTRTPARRREPVTTS